MSKEVRIYLLVVSSFLVGLIYDLVDLDWKTQKDFFPFFDGYNGWDGKMSLANYVYGYCGHAVMLMIWSVLIIDSGRKIYQVCFILETIDLIDYALRYNYTWFTVFDCPIEYNHFKVLSVTLCAIKYYGNDTARA